MPESKQCVSSNVPWYERAHDTKTLASTRRYVDYIDPEAPRDTLDFRLNSVYDQHGDYNKNLQESVLQKESLRLLTECQLKTLKDAKAERLPPYTCLKGHGSLVADRNENINISEALEMVDDSDKNPNENQGPVDCAFPFSHYSPDSSESDPWD
ncbi:hypothetical protein CRM22_005098 [Opisthorchis felineus]|uniref:Uncharacterized protein n=1 Tax=Opisthorchis felineus TaxID=147828 RepID=A0A4S2LST7_OPIFE|nr:hypothetical protein CRM22_005098 [Opisthorchis felineus]